MTIGEIEYTATIIDQLNSTVPGTNIPLVPFSDSTYIFYYVFILIMPIALVNLLVSIYINRGLITVLVSAVVSFSTSTKTFAPQFPHPVV